MKWSIFSSGDMPRGNLHECFATVSEGVNAYGDGPARDVARVTFSAIHGDDAKRAALVTQFKRDLALMVAAPDMAAELRAALPIVKAAAHRERDVAKARAVKAQADRIADILARIERGTP